MDPSLGMLLERLHWPVPRVRWETARALARLVRTGEDGALDALIGWTADRSLESECLLGLGVIHAFELAAHCPEDAARRAVSKPSPASDWMLRAIYGTRERSAPFRYAVSPRTPAGLDDDDDALFDRFNARAVPPAFLHTLERLEGALDFAFIDRWRHDWAWICRSHGTRAPETQFLLGRGRSGSLNMPLGEMLVSAYLRTLAYAMHIGTLRADEAEYHAMLALPMNRGLAALEPVNRPAWSRNLLRRWRESGRTLVDELWAQAAACCGEGEIPASLRLTEACEKDFIEIRVDVVVGHGAFTAAEPSAESPEYAWDDAETGSMAGDLRLREGALGPVTGPLTWACPVAPEHVGRVETTVALQVRLACLGLGWRGARVRCRENHVELQANDEVVSRWHHWYANWEPSKFAWQDSDVSGMTTVRRSWVRGYSESSGLSVALLGRVRVGTREHTYQDHTVRVDEFWTDREEPEILAAPALP